jgi:hypothetical protein
LTGGDPLNAAALPDLDTTNFWGKNMDFAASAKFCVDATGWTGAWMQFDLRQTMSIVYQVQFGQPIPQASSLRVVVNGNQIGGTYNPATEINDPFRTQFADLSAYAGTQFEVVFESRMGFSEAADPTSTFPFNSEGDNAYIDNILFAQIPLGVEEQENLESISVYPNPNKGEFTINFTAFTINFTAVGNELGTLEIIDVLGNLVKQENLQLNKGFNKLAVDISNYPNSIYFVKVTTDVSSYTTRVIKK